jgi:hypothetical protein
LAGLHCEAAPFVAGPFWQPGLLFWFVDGSYLWSGTLVFCHPIFLSVYYIIFPLEFG